MRKFIRKTWVIADFEIRKMMHDPTEVLMRAVQPALWLLIFGQVMVRTRMMPGVNYLDFMSPGILAQSVLFVSI
ncbi:MAG: ABC transporter permease, partial [Bacteroidia bacterium]